MFSPRFLAALRFCFSALYCAVKKTRRLASSIVVCSSRVFSKSALRRKNTFSPLYLYYPTRGVPTSISPLAPRAACGRSPVCHPFTRAFSPVPVAPASGSITAAKLRSISAARSASGRAIPGASGASASASRRAATRRSSSAPKRRERAPMAGKRWRSFECGSESSSMSGPTLSGHLGSSRGGGRLERGAARGTRAALHTGERWRHQPRRIALRRLLRFDSLAARIGELVPEAAERGEGLGVEFAAPRKRRQQARHLVEDGRLV